jgi:hypothetical protein
VGENYFELSIPPFLSLHPIFNVVLQPYFPPLLDTSKVVKNLSPREINLECIKKATVDHIMDTKMKGTFQQNIQLYDNFFTKASGSPVVKFRKKNSHLMRELDEMGTIASYGEK